MEELFKIHFHPVDQPAERIRFLERVPEESVQRVRERQVNGRWERIDAAIIDYADYADRRFNAFAL